MATLVAERSPRALDPRAPAGAPSAASVSDFMRGTALLDPVLGFPVARGRAPMVYNAPFAPTGFGAAFVSLEVAPDDYPFALNAHCRTKIAPGAFVLISRNAATVGLLDDCGDAVRIAATSAAGIARPLTPRTSPKTEPNTTNTFCAGAYPPIESEKEIRRWRPPPKSRKASPRNSSRNWTTSSHARGRR